MGIGDLESRHRTWCKMRGRDPGCVCQCCRKARGTDVACVLSVYCEYTVKWPRKPKGLGYPACSAPARANPNETPSCELPEVLERNSI